MKRIELETFQAVAARGSFSLAAQSLKLTQPAVSKRIANLEAGLDVRLFDRLGKRVALTPAGQALARETPKVLSALGDAERAIADLSGEPSGRLRIATSHHIGLHLLAPILRDYASRYPAVRLDLRFEDSEDAHGLVASGQVELAIVTLTLAQTAGARQGTLLEEVVWEDPLVFVAARDHVLSGRKRLRLEDLARAPAILPGPKTYTGRIVAGLFADAGLSIEPALSTNYLETVQMLVSAGLGWSMLPERLSEALTRLPLKERAHRQLGLVSDPARSLSMAATRFAERVRAFGSADAD